MRRNIFVGAHAPRERKSFRGFLKKHFQDKLRNIDEKVAEMVFNDKENVRTSKILQKLFIEVYEFYIKGNEKIEKELLDTLRIKYNKDDEPSEVLMKLVESLKSKRKYGE